MRIRFLFLVLQSVLLCAAVQADPGAPQGVVADNCAALQTLGCDDKPFQENPDNDIDMQPVDNSIALSPSLAVFGFLPPRHHPHSRRIDRNSIRGPPSLA